MKTRVAAPRASRLALTLASLACLAACQSGAAPAPTGSTAAPLSPAASASASGSAPAAVSAPLATASAASPLSSARRPASSAQPASPLPPIEVDKVTAVIVWQKDEKAKGGFRSQWVEQVAGKATMVAEKPGLVAVSSTSLWTLGTTIVKGCSQLAHDKDGSVMVRGDLPLRERPDLQMPELVRQSDGLRVAAWKDGHGYPIHGTQCDPALEEYGVDVRFEGGMGAFLMASVNSYESYGGAHGLRGSELMTMDLESGATVKLLAPAPDREALNKAAAKGLGVEPKEVSPSGVVLLYGPVGVGLALYRFWTSASYAGSEGGNSYSNDHVVSSKSLPVEVEAHRSLPAWVVPYLKGRSLNVFMIVPSQTAMMKKQFDAAYSALPVAPP